MLAVVVYVYEDRGFESIEAFPYMAKARTQLLSDGFLPTGDKKDVWKKGPFTAYVLHIADLLRNAGEG